MSQDRITKIRVQGMKAIKDVTLELNGLTVLIGDNGSGKSTILEAFELLRQAGKPVAFIEDILNRNHGGLSDLLRHGSEQLTIGVTVEGAGPKLDYCFSLGFVGTFGEVIRETLDCYYPEHKEPLHALIRKIGDRAQYYEPTEKKLNPIELSSTSLAVASFGITAHPAFRRIVDALNRIDLQVPFETRPLWQLNELDVRKGPRWQSMVRRTDGRVSRFGLDLANSYQHLRSRGEEVWSRVLDRARLGLGEDLRDILLVAADPPGTINLELVFGRAPNNPIPARTLSEGQLSYLSFLALTEHNSQRSLLAFDEPEVHMHPALLTRVLWMFERVSHDCPVVLATHSDRLLDALEAPEKSAVLCELDEQGATCTRRPNPERLARWLEDYRGLGSLRAEGYQENVFNEASCSEKDTDGAS